MGCGLDVLSPREQEFFVLFLEGHPMKEIACQMQIDPRTASGLKARLMKKLKIGTDVRLVLFGVRMGLLEHGHNGEVPLAQQH